MLFSSLLQIGLHVRYMEEPEFALQLGILTALALVPPQAFQGFAAICNKIRVKFDVTESASLLWGHLHW